MKCSLIAVIGLLLLVSRATQTGLQGTIYGPVEVCNREHYNATCGPGQVVIMHAARYGRMGIGKCVKRDLGYLSCAVDVLSHMHGICSGRLSCDMKVPDDTLYETQPCPEDTTSYLEVSHSCVKVGSVAPGVCHHRRPLVLTTNTGYLSTALAENKGFGTRTCPWQIEAKPGQKINLTLHTFIRLDREIPDRSAHDSNVCYEIAEVQEPGHDSLKSILACLQEKKPHNVYTSLSNSVTIVIPKRSVLNDYAAFLIEYKAIGCPELSAPSGAWIHTNDDTATVRCNDTGETWYLTCKEGRWLGKSGPCGHEVEQENNWPMEQIFPFDGFPYGILAAVAIGVALGVFLGGVLLAFIVMKSRRSNAKDKRQSKLVEYNCTNPDDPWTNMQLSHHHGNNIPDEFTMEKVQFTGHMTPDHMTSSTQHSTLDKLYDRSVSVGGGLESRPVGNNTTGTACTLHMYETTARIPPPPVDLH